jgi:hypothetical protein
MVFASNETGIRAVSLHKNGSSYVGGASYRALNTAVGTAVSASTEAELALNDYIEVQALQNSGAEPGLPISDGSTGVPAHAAMSLLP